MTARERILTIRLMERIAKNPSCAEALGIRVTGKLTSENPDNEGSIVLEKIRGGK